MRLDVAQAMYFSNMIQLSDEAFLERASTSPQHEGPTFVRGVWCPVMDTPTTNTSAITEHKNAMRWILQHCTTLLNGGIPAQELAWDAGELRVLHD